jgi:hypothetical protein
MSVVPSTTPPAGMASFFQGKTAVFSKKVSADVLLDWRTIPTIALASLQVSSDTDQEPMAVDFSTKVQGTKTSIRITTLHLPLTQTFIIRSCHFTPMDD